MNDLVVGIDPSSRKLGIVVLRIGNLDEPVAMHQVPLDRGPGGVSKAYNTVLGLFFDEPIAVLALEAPTLVKGAVQSMLVQAYVNGAIQAACFDAGVPVAIVPPSQWKKEIVGNGGSGKPAVAEWLGRRHPGLSGVCGGDQDLTDASCLALYGAALCEWSVGLDREGSM